MKTLSESYELDLRIQCRLIFSVHSINLILYEVYVTCADSKLCSYKQKKKVSHNRPRWPKGFRVV